MKSERWATSVRKAPAPLAKIKGALPENGVVPLEIVLHAGDLEGEVNAIEEFGRFLEARKLPHMFGRRFYAQGLCFIELDAPGERAEEIASFSTVRALRKMPELRVLRPPIRSSGIPSSKPTLPTDPVVSEATRVAIFDGGVPDGHPLTEWVTPYELEGMLPATAELHEHGVAVTSAALFGHIDPKKPIPRPFAVIDHYRVLDEDPHQDPHELYEVLERIECILASKEYDFINLSIGPCLPIEDDDVHAWTAVLDDRLARTSTLAAIAVGNDGESDSATGLDRVQVPSDCVNALAIGACDTTENDWVRAPYSSVGPGRSPGLIKPDLVGFGGSVARPFVVLSHELDTKLTTTGGTSFATPSIVRIASGVRAHFGLNLNHLAIRALLDPREIGWGREGRNFAPDQKLPYALVVSVQANAVADLYDQIVRRYAARLEPLRPVLEVPVQT